MKKWLSIIIVIIVCLSLIGGVIWCIDYLNQHNKDTLISHPPLQSMVVLPVPAEESNEIFLTPPVVSIQATFGEVIFSSINEQWSRKFGEENYYLQYHSKKETEGINTVFSTEGSVSFSFERNPGTFTIEVYDVSTEELVMSASSENFVVPVMDRQGDFHYVIRIGFEEEDALYKGEYLYSYTLSVDLPVSFLFDKLTLAQGDFLTVTVKNTNEGEIPVLKQSVFKWFKFYKEGNDYIGYLPAGYYTNKGTYELSYGIEGQTLNKEFLTVVPYHFKVQYLYINETLAAATKNDESSAEYAKYFSPVRWQSHDEAYYTESFVIPAYGNLSTEFGENRYTNGLPTSYHHSGLDIGNVIGSPIYATNRGKVVLSRHLIMTGNTIVIDHGQGLFSVYFHMDSLISSLGDMVERGQQIGYMGTTGFSTGSHLHFTMSFYDVNIEPGYLLVGEPITKENQKQYLN